MAFHLFLIMLPVIFGLHGQREIRQATHYITKHRSEDSLPPLHTIKNADISTVTSNHQNGTVTVILKNGAIYTYNRDDWDYEDYYPNTPQILKNAIGNVKITFTRAERMPQFPGSQEAWTNYLREFCLQYQEQINNYGPAEFTVRFIVHIHGQLSDVEIAEGNANSDLSSLAIKCIKYGPLWTSATQNGHLVPCYQTQVVKFSR
jgi:hypothetical protein